jgi:glycine cleavage system aminomethyltransferase T
VRVGAELVGRVTSGGYGYTLGRSIAYAYLPAPMVTPGTSVEVEIFGEWMAGEVAGEPLYDPKGARLRG